MPNRTKKPGKLRPLISGVEGEAWLRFFVAVGGLIIAFAAALLSTAAREAGNLLATALLASSALMIAAIVGLLTVPYLAKRVAVRSVGEALNYDVTREGLAYLAFTLLIAIGALNTGNNLLFLVVSAMLGAVLVSGIASALVLMGVEVDFELPQHIFAEQSYAAMLSVRSIRRWLPAFSVTIGPAEQPPRSQWTWRRSKFVFPKARDGKRAWIHWPDLSLVRIKRQPPPTGVLRERIYHAYIPAAETVKTEVELRFERRGRFRQDSLAVSSRFPFSFLVKTRTVQLAREIVVYPPVEQTEEFFEVLPMITGEFEAYVRGRGYDLYRIRDYQPEDSARHVDWKSTAKSGTLKVREFTREDERKLRIVFDNPRPAIVSSERYERGIALAASLAWHFAASQTELTFAAPGLSGSNSVYDFLAYLADAQADNLPSIVDSMEVTDDYNVVITARPRGTIPTALWQASYFIFLGD